MSDDRMSGPEEFAGARQVPEQQPQGQDVPEDEGVLQPGDTLETDDLRSDPLDTGVSPPERHPASERHGVTASEAREGETLDQRLAQEEPDVDAPETQAPPETGASPEAETPEEAGDEEGELPERRAGRLVAPDEGSHTAREPAYLARDVGVDGAAASAEEAAVHIVDDKQGSDG